MKRGLKLKNILKVNGKMDLKKFVVSVLGSEGIGFLSAAFTLGTMSLYNQLVQPSFSPPGWIFGPVWTILYFLMGFASYRIWMTGISNRESRKALFYYGIQLGLNFFWSILFFKFQLRGIAFIEIVTLLLFIIITSLKFNKIDKIATYLMLPYIVWVTFASVLNFSIWSLNPWKCAPIKSSTFPPKIFASRWLNVPKICISSRDIQSWGTPWFVLSKASFTYWAVVAGKAHQTKRRNNLKWKWWE